MPVLFEVQHCLDNENHGKKIKNPTGLGLKTLLVGTEMINNPAPLLTEGQKRYKIIWQQQRFDPVRITSQALPSRIAIQDFYHRIGRRMLKDFGECPYCEEKNKDRYHTVFECKGTEQWHPQVPEMRDKVKRPINKKKDKLMNFRYVPYIIRLWSLWKVHWQIHYGTIEVEDAPQTLQYIIRDEERR